MIALRWVLRGQPRRGGEEGLPLSRRLIRYVKVEGPETVRAQGGSCTERRGVVISMTGGVEGVESGRK